jgi:hypothetical protein
MLAKYRRSTEYRHPDKVDRVRIGQDIFYNKLIVRV